MDTALLATFYTLLLFVIVAMIWSVRDQNAKTHTILNNVAEIQRDIARMLGADRR
jgi:hypothetical protein